MNIHFINNRWPTPTMDRGRTPWATGLGEAFCLLTKGPPAESRFGCHLQSYDRCSGPFVRLPLCFAKVTNLELRASLHLAMIVSTKPAISLERECWTVFEILGWFLSGVAGVKQLSLKIGRGQMQPAKLKLPSRNQSQAESSAVWQKSLELFISILTVK